MLGGFKTSEKVTRILDETSKMGQGKKKNSKEKIVPVEVVADLFFRLCKSPVIGTSESGAR